MTHVGVVDALVSQSEMSLTPEVALVAVRFLHVVSKIYCHFSFHDLHRPLLTVKLRRRRARRIRLRVHGLSCSELFPRPRCLIRRLGFLLMAFGLQCDNCAASAAIVILVSA